MSSWRLIGQQDTLKLDHALNYNIDHSRDIY